MVPRKGAEVAQISEKNLKDVLEVRVALDSLAVRLACERITQEEIEELKKACKAFEETTKDKEADAAKIAQADVAFHDVISRATGNERLLQMISNLSEQMYRYRFEYLKDVSRYDNLIEEHRVIYESIRKRDKDAARSAAELHIDNQAKAIIRQIRLDKESKK